MALTPGRGPDQRLQGQLLDAFAPQLTTRHQRIEHVSAGRLKLPEATQAGLDVVAARQVLL
jgi:hypothetical protein